MYDKKTRGARESKVKIIEMAAAVINLIIRAEMTCWHFAHYAETRR